ncbi:MULTISPECIES: GNAT family N-acetyltransferase [Clostridium]|uniref:GNAT family N-acetyltransferase n=1 Tax=Clostridium lapidicellarium TaxID=3240931 RepID=A0ABV4E1C2_9CLOT
MLKGKKVYLAAVERNDLALFMNWRNREDFRKYFREYREINCDMQNNWYESKVLNDSSTIMFSIKRIDDNRLLGCCGLCYLNWIYRYAEISIYIGLDNVYIDNKGYAEESCKLLFEYGFNNLGLNKIWTEIYEFDALKKQLLDKFNFHLDGVLRENYFYNGKWYNSFILSLLNKEFNE